MFLWGAVGGAVRRRDLCACSPQQLVYIVIRTLCFGAGVKTNVSVTVFFLVIEFV